MLLAYAFRILFAAGNPVTESIARRDTVIAFTQTAALPEDAVVGTAVPLKLQPADAARITLSVINGTTRSRVRFWRRAGTSRRSPAAHWV